MRALCVSIIAVAMPLSADMLQQPSLFPDGQSLSLTAPGLGDKVIAIPNALYAINYNDNVGNTAPGVQGDYDFQDLMAWALFNATATSYRLTYIASVSWDDNRLGGLGGPILSLGESADYASTPGENTPVFLYDFSTGYTFVTGPDSFNGDNAIHAQVLRVDHPAPVPEPASWQLMATGLALLAVGMKRRMAR